ncbi:hypothetical protein VNO77_19264 [Canavalia gladiata]|uniref:Uncharacterized protein n=1 Tax=Canavalia gladiata TaxID=3824 RepID=A0AAN9QKC5_CANGL
MQIQLFIYKEKSRDLDINFFDPMKPFLDVMVTILHIAILRQESSLYASPIPPIWLCDLGTIRSPSFFFKEDVPEVFSSPSCLLLFLIVNNSSLPLREDQVAHCQHE